MRSGRLLFTLAATSMIGCALAVAPSYNSDPAQWTSEDVYQILNSSPWTKAVKVKISSGESSAFGQTANADANVNNNRQQFPAGVGGTGRRGIGGGRSGGTYSSGGSAPSGPAKSSPTEIKIQWQSALAIRIAIAKKSGGTIDAVLMKPLDDYVIAVIGLPITAVGGRSASADSDSTLGAEQEQRIAENVKKSAAILRSGHNPISPTTVELDQGSDGRMLIHFSKSDAIQATDKTVEFRLQAGKTEIRRKFALKDMEFQGKLEL